jgi:hypothetical protein
MTTLAVTVHRQKGAQIVLGDPDDAAKSVDNKVARLDPPSDRTGGDAETFRQLGNRKELDLIVAVVATPKSVDSRCVRESWSSDQAAFGVSGIAVAGGP